MYIYSMLALVINRFCIKEKELKEFAILYRFSTCLKNMYYTCVYLNIAFQI